MNEFPSKLVHTVKLRNGLLMPLIGLGTSLRGKNTSAESFMNSVSYAIECGYRLIDTAKSYNNEHLVGESVKNCGIPREDLFLTSKLYPDDMGYEKALEAFEQSCKKLQVDYLGYSSYILI